ncbi:hypothetical protein ACP275_08G104100 [Erythranthe tilingii]
MRDSGKRVKLSQAPLSNLRKVKSNVTEKHSSEGDVKPKMSMNHLAWYVALNTKPSEQKNSRIPRIKWKCPPKFYLNTSWHVAAGEGSQEAEAQKFREITVQKIIYPTLSKVPPSLYSSPDIEGGANTDDSEIPIIPIIPIEAEAGEEAEKPLGTSPSVSNNDKSRADILQHGLESVGTEVATAATIMPTEEQMDGHLLIKFLAHTEIVKKLTVEHGTPPPAPEEEEANTPSSVLPSSAPDDKLADGSTEALSTLITSNSSPQKDNQSPSLPCSEVQKAINKPANKQDDIRSASEPIWKSRKLSPLARFSNSVVPPNSRPNEETINRLVDQCAPPPGGIAQVRPLIMPCNLRTGEETIEELMERYAPPPRRIAQVNQVRHCNLRPQEETIEQLIAKYGPAPHGVGGYPPPLNPSPNMGGIKRMIDEYGVADHGWRNTPNLHAFPNMSESNFNANGNFQFPLYPHLSTPPPALDLHYKSTNQQHGERRHDSRHFSEPTGHYYMQGLELGHNRTTSIETNKKREKKTCMYFNSPKGCRNGYNCLYEHDMSKHWRDGGSVDVPVAKRIKCTLRGPENCAGWNW